MLHAVVVLDEGGNWVEYKSPHKLRNGHGVFGVKAAKTIEDFKAFSQNMGHESLVITDRLYGKLAGDDVKRIITNSLSGETDDDLLRELLDVLSKHQKI